MTFKINNTNGEVFGKEITRAASWKSMEIPQKKKGFKEYDAQLNRDEGDAWLAPASGRENEAEPLSMGRLLIYYYDCFYVMNEFTTWESDRPFT